MSSRRNFIKALVAGSVLVPVSAGFAEEKPMEDESDAKVYCCHCYELTGRGHSCPGYDAFKRENSL